MAVEDLELDAQIAAARELATIGAVDHPLAPVLNALGIKFRPGQRVWDALNNEVVEVVHAGTVEADSATVSA